MTKQRLELAVLYFIAGGMSVVYLVLILAFGFWMLHP